MVAKGTVEIESAATGNVDVAVTRTAARGSTVYSGRDGGRRVTLTITRGRCRGANGTDTGRVATLSVGGRTLTGCAVAGAHPIAGT